MNSNRHRMLFGMASVLLLVFGLSSSFAFSQDVPDADSTSSLIDRAGVIGSAVEKIDDPKYVEVDRAITAYLKGDLTTAEKECAAANTAHAELPPAAVMLAQMHFAVGRIDHGRRSLEQATQTEPSDPEAYLIFAELALAHGELTAAEVLAEKSLQLLAQLRDNPKRATALRINGLAALAEISSARNQWAKTIVHSQALIKLDPKSVRGQSQLARALLHQGKAAQAYATLKKMREQNPKVLLPEITMGLLYEELVARGDTAKRENARRAMEAAVKAAPKDLAVRLIVAQWALDACQIELAEENAKAALSIDKDSPEALSFTGIVARHRGDHAAAITAFETAIKEQPRRSELALQLALSLVAAEKFDDAQLHAQNAVRFASDANRAAQGYIVLAVVSEKLGEKENAMAALAQALRGPLQGEYALLAAMMLTEQGEKEQAARLLPAAGAAPCFPQAERLTELSRQLQ